jgi:hypothetical protein
MREHKNRNKRTNEMKILFKGIRDANAKRRKRAEARIQREMSDETTESV